jgi:hypothetical protein
MKKWALKGLEIFMLGNRATISAATICFALMVCTNAGVAAQTISWEIENGFRYFKRASDYREVLRIYNSEKSATNPKPTALQLEIALEKAAAQQREFNNIEGNDSGLGGQHLPAYLRAPAGSHAPQLRIGRP